MRKIVDVDCKFTNGQNSCILRPEFTPDNVNCSVRFGMISIVLYKYLQHVKALVFVHGSKLIKTLFF